MAEQKDRCDPEMEALGWDTMSLLCFPPVMLTEEMQADLDEDMAAYRVGALGYAPASWRRKPDWRDEP